MKPNPIVLLLLILFNLTGIKTFSQFITNYPLPGNCTGCTDNPNGNITLSTNNATVCYTGTGTIPTLTINGNNVTVYICGNITITNISGNGTSSNIVVNTGKTLTLTNQPSNFWAVPTYVNYGTMNISSSWDNFYSGNLITVGSSAVTNISGNLTLNGGQVQIDGGTLNVTGKTTPNSGTGGIYLKSNGTINTIDLTNNATDRIIVEPGSLGNLYFTGTATVWNELTNSPALSVMKSPSGTSNGGNWGASIQPGTCYAPPCNSVLPLLLGNFSLNNLSSKVIIDWSTYIEQHNSHFEIQRSNDAKTFAMIGTVAASGNSASEKNYSFTDFYPLIGKNYYRIAIVSDDGNSSYSTIKEMEYEPRSEMNIIVNNAQGNIKVIIPQNTSASTIRLLDMQGRVLKIVRTQTEVESANITTEEVATGVYIIELISNQIHQAKQVLLTSSR